MFAALKNLTRQSPSRFDIHVIKPDNLPLFRLSIQGYIRPLSGSPSRETGFNRSSRNGSR